MIAGDQPEALWLGRAAGALECVPSVGCFFISFVCCCKISFVRYCKSRTGSAQALRFQATRSSRPLNLPYWWQQSRLCSPSHTSCSCLFAVLFKGIST